MKLFYKTTFLAVIALLTTISTLAYTTTTFYVDGLSYTTSMDGTSVSVGGNLSKAKGKISIPSSVNHGGTTYPVTSISDGAFSECSDLTSIEIPSSVTSIGQGPFRGCIGLTSIKVDPANTIYDSRENCNAIIKTATNELIAGCKTTEILHP